MNFDSLLPLTGAAFGGLLAIAALLRSNRITSRRSFAAGITLLALESLLIGLYADRSLRENIIIQWQQWRLITLSLVPGTWILFSLSYARGDAQKTMGRWKIPLIITIVLPFIFSLLFRQDLLQPVTDNGSWHLQLGWAGIAIHGFLLIGAVIVLMNIERTYRASVGTIRWRIKFMLSGVGVLFLVRIYTSSQHFLFHSVDPLVESVNAGALLVSAILFVKAFFRDQDFNLDIYPSQSVLHNSLTALLAGVYLLFIGVFAKVVWLFGGDSSFALKAFLVLVALVVLTVLLQSDRVRLHIRRFVTSHFQRPFYDYRLVWKKFTDGTASCVDQPELSNALVRLLADMLQALSVSLWLLDDQKEKLRLTASTSVSNVEKPEEQQAGSQTLIDYFQTNPEPIDFESMTTPWANTLRSWHPTEFNNGGHRICIPIVGHGEMLGLITIGDRVGGVPFSLQDLELLKCACDHAAASLLNIQLSRKLLQAKELEAFQTMAAFFVHDLKNAASTLNLILQNLPEHFDDPEFRADALRGTAKSVAHINHLIGRLGMLRHELKLQPKPGDLNQLVAASVTDLESGPHLTLTKSFEPIPPFPFDRDQIAKVIINLVLNAREAISSEGKIHLETSRTNNWAIFTCRDNGCGMSPDYISRSLFKPFQTTKKSGLGIGMFQSKMIVEAHGGRITVASEKGQGTTFQVFLPLTR